MADMRDVVNARSEADAAQRYLETYLSQIEDGERAPESAFVCGLAAVALCERLKALAVQLDHAEGRRDV